MSSEFNPDVVRLIDHTTVEWDDIPEPFRYVVNKKALTKLIRNSSDVTVSTSVLGEVRVYKAHIAALIQEHNDKTYFAAIFNGLDLTILGPVNEAWYEDRQDYYMRKD